MDTEGRSKEMAVSFEAKLKAGFKWDDEAGVFVTYAPALQVFSQGKTKTQAKRALNDAVALLLTTAYELNMLEKVFKGAGLAPIPDDTSVSQLDEYISVQEEVLEEQEYNDFFDFTPKLNLAAIA